MHDIIEKIQDGPPRCVAGFTVFASDSIENPPDHFAWVAFDLKCANCGGSTFTLKGLSVHWGEPPKTSEVGVESVCETCGRKAQLFDMLIDGYDGELGHYQFMEGPRTRTALDDYDQAPAEIRLTFIFNATMADLSQTATETGKRPQDFFDGFNIAIRRPPEPEWIDLWQCECA